MSEWKSWSRQFERDLRGAVEGVRGSFAAGDAHEILENAAEFAQTIAECAITPVAAFLAGLPRMMDGGACSEPQRANASDWDDES
jgi:hypothetical protein